MSGPPRGGGRGPPAAGARPMQPPPAPPPIANGWRAQQPAPRSQYGAPPRQLAPPAPPRSITPVAPTPGGGGQHATRGVAVGGANVIGTSQPLALQQSQFMGTQAGGSMAAGFNSMMRLDPVSVASSAASTAGGT